MYRKELIFMYKVIKGQGYGANVSVENTDTLATVMIGRADTTVISILEKQGYKFGATHGDGIVSYDEEWSLAVNKEIAEELVHLALNIKKPFRDQRKKPEEEKKVGVEVDAFDLIYGI